VSARRKLPSRFVLDVDNPQQRPWIHKRVNQYMEKNPHVKVDFQWFTFADLGKKVSVGYATGTAPDGFVTGDWLMPTWLARNLIAPLDVKLLGYSSLDAFRRTTPTPSWRRDPRTVRPMATNRSGSSASAIT